MHHTSSLVSFSSQTDFFLPFILLAEKRGREGEIRRAPNSAGEEEKEREKKLFRTESWREKRRKEGKEKKEIEEYDGITERNGMQEDLTVLLTDAELDIFVQDEKIFYFHATFKLLLTYSI